MAFISFAIITKHVLHVDLCYEEFDMYSENWAIAFYTKCVVRQFWCMLLFYCPLTRQNIDKCLLKETEREELSFC